MHRRTWLAFVLFTLVVGLSSSRTYAQTSAATPTKVRVYVGTYTGPKSKGIYRFELNLANGQASAVELAGETTSPSFLAIHPTQKYLYAVNEIGNFNGQKTGSVTAFAIDATTGNLTQLNQQESGGSGPCHLVVDAAGKSVLVANYGGGSVASLSIEADGRLTAPVSVLKHVEPTPSEGKPKQALAHSINLDAKNRFAFAADKGLDKVFSYRFDAAKSTLAANDPPFVAVAPGSGPRHLAFHPTGKFAYVINEISSGVTAFSYDAEAGKLTEIQTLSTLPEPVKGNSTAEIVVHPSGKFLYGSNRGHDSLAIYTIDAATGKLTAVGHHPTGGKTPRNFAIDPTGKYLLAENQGSGTIHVLSIDQNTGLLSPTGTVVEVPSPVCVRFVSLGN